jgi:hypothetical protein
MFSKQKELERRIKELEEYTVDLARRIAVISDQLYVPFNKPQATVNEAVTMILEYFDLKVKRSPEKKTLVKEENQS